MKQSLFIVLALLFTLHAVAQDMKGELGGVNVTMNIYGAVGQDVEQLANIVSDKLADQLARRKAVYA